MKNFNLSSLKLVSLIAGIVFITGNVFAQWNQTGGNFSIPSNYCGTNDATDMFLAIHPPMATAPALNQVHLLPFGETDIGNPTTSYYILGINNNISNALANGLALGWNN